MVSLTHVARASFGQILPSLMYFNVNQAAHLKGLRSSQIQSSSIARLCSLRPEA